MKQGIKNILIFTTGAAVGSAVTTLALRAFYTKFINETLTEEVNKQMDDIKAEYTENLEKIKAEMAGNIQKDEQIVQDSAKKAPKSEKLEPKKKTKEEKKEEATDYTKFSEGKKKKTVKDVRTEAMKQIEKETTNSEGNYIITFGDYTSDNGYEKVTSTFYQGDGVFTNDYDDPDPDMPSIVGNLVEKFDDYGEGNSLYIRSDQRETDYEIIFDDGCYGE